MYEQDSDKCSLLALQKNKLLKLEFITELVQDLQLDHSQDTATIIPNFLLQRVHSRVSKEHANIRRVFGLIDRRKNADNDSLKNTISLLNSTLKS